MAKGARKLTKGDKKAVIIVLSTMKIGIYSNYSDKWPESGVFLDLICYKKRVIFGLLLSLHEACKRTNPKLSGKRTRNPTMA